MKMLSEDKQALSARGIPYSDMHLWRLEQAGQFPTQPGPLADLLKSIPREIRVHHFYPGPVWIFEIEILPSGLFVSIEGEDANSVVIPCRVGGPDTRLFDLVAQHVDGRVATLRGDADLLGYDRYNAADFWKTRLRLYRTPVQWLANDGNGVCVLDWFRAKRLIADLPELLLDDSAHADEVAERLKPCRKRPALYVLREKSA
jgi:hypothetical protein